MPSSRPSRLWGCTILVCLFGWKSVPVVNAFSVTGPSGIPRLSPFPYRRISSKGAGFGSATGSILILRQEAPKAGSGGTDGGSDNLIPNAINFVSGGLKVMRDLDSKAQEEEEEEDDDELVARTNKNDSNATLQNSTLAADQHNNSQSGGLNKTVLQDLPQALGANLEAFQFQLKKFQKGRFRLFRVSTIVRSLSAWAFDVTSTVAVNKTSPFPWNTNKDGERRIDGQAFYSGILLIHLHLAKYVGVAACHPPDREQIEELFRLADADRSGCLNREEFTNAAIVACAPITSRIVTYYALVVAILPWVVSNTMKGCRWILEATHSTTPFLHHVSTPLMGNVLKLLEWWVNRTFSIVLFSVVVPYWFGRVDDAVRKWARKRSQNSLWWLAGSTKRKTKGKKDDSWSKWFSDFYHADWRWSHKAAIGKNTTTVDDKPSPVT